MADTPETLTLTLSTAAATSSIKLRPDLAPRPCRADRRARQRRLLRRRRVPPRHPRLHGAGRRSDRHRHARLGQAQPAGRILEASRMCAAPPRWRGRRDPNSANSQFFICFDDARFLDGQYTVWGEVTDGHGACRRAAQGRAAARARARSSRRTPSNVRLPLPCRGEGQGEGLSHDCGPSNCPRPTSLRSATLSRKAGEGEQLRPLARRSLRSASRGTAAPGCCVSARGRQTNQ